LIVTRAGPGRPTTESRLDDVVGGTPNPEPSVGLEASLMGISSMPSAISVFVPFSPEAAGRETEALPASQLPATPRRAEGAPAFALNDTFDGRG
jgi:hypothetical protein